MSNQNVTLQESSYLKEQLTARMIQILVEEYGYTLEDAIDKIYTSPIYEKLSEPYMSLRTTSLSARRNVAGDYLRTAGRREARV